MAFSLLLSFRRAREVRRGRDAEDAAGTALLYESENAARGPSRLDGNRDVEPTRRIDVTSGEEVAGDSRVREAPARVLSARDLRDDAVLDDGDEDLRVARHAGDGYARGTRGVRDDADDGFRLAGGLSDGVPRSLLVAPDELGPAVHDHLRRVDAAWAPEAPGIRALALRVLRGRKWVLPAEVVPVIHMEGQRHHERAGYGLVSGEAREEPVGRGTARAALGREELDENWCPCGRG